MSLPLSIKALERVRVAGELLERLRLEPEPVGETEPAPVDEVTTDLPVDAPVEEVVSSKANE